MPTKQEYSLMSAAVYNDARGDLNKVDVATLGWAIVASKSDTAGGLLSSGLSINAYKKGSEVVIACKGTDFLVGSNNSQTASDLIADIALGGSLGFSSSQLFAAALFYQQVKRDNPGAVITFTGHSLGAGLASILSVWFDKPATIFADAPFETTALNPLVMGYVAGFLALNGFSDPAFVDFIATYPFTYGGREAQVTSYYVEGEVLNKWLGLLPFVVGNNIPIHIGGGDQFSAIGGPLTLHSIVLHSAFQLNELNGDQLRKDTLVLPTLLARIFDAKLYAFKLESGKADFLTDVLKAQISHLGGDMSTGKLSHFADDMNKLGTNVAGLTKAAQDALIAQGIEWYYWQNTDQQFYTQTGTLLQYTSAQGAALPDAQNKALLYVSAWLDPSVRAESSFNIGYKFEQWNVVAGTAGATATALNVAKTQIFVGNDGGDTFTGGEKDDFLLGGAGADTLTGGVGMDHLFGGADVDILDGGPGGDFLYGGAGDDRYELTTGELWDTIQDSDGNGKIFVSGAQLTGGKKVDATYWISDDQLWGYLLTSTGNLVISKYGSADRIVVEGWSSAKNVGITLDDAPAPVVVTPGVYSDSAHTGDDLLGSGDVLGHATFEGRDGLDYTSWDLTGLAGNDLMFGFKFADKLDGGDGDDRPIVGSMHLASDLFTLRCVDGRLRYPQLRSGDPMTTETKHQQHNLTQPCRRARRASVSARLRARGPGVCGAQPALRQHLGLHANSAAAANGLRRSGTATRHVCGLGWSGRDKYQNREVPSMRIAGPKLPAGRMDRATTATESDALL